MRVSTPRARSLAAAAAVLGAIALVAGCGSSSKSAAAKSGSAPSAQIPAKSILRAADISSTAAGYRVALTEHVTSAATNVDATATGSYTPSAHEADLDMQLTVPGSGQGPEHIQVVLDQGTIYFQLPPALAGQIPGAKPWLSINLAQAGQLAGVPGLGSLVSDSSSFDNPTEYLDFLRATADGTVKDLGQETVNGIQTTHYQAEVDFAKLPDVVPAADRQSMQQLVDALSQKVKIPDYPVDVWIDGASLVRRLQENLTETVSGKPVSVAITENFLSYGPQPAPTVPSSDQTSNLLSLVHGS